MEQYIGPKKIKSIEDAGFKTPLGNQIYKVTYVNDEVEIMTVKTFNLSVTTEPKDYNFLRDIKYNQVFKDIISVVAEYNIIAGELNSFLNSLGNEFENAFNRATNYLWKKNDKIFTPGSDPVFSVSLLEAHKVLLDMSLDMNNIKIDDSKKETAA